MRRPTKPKADKFTKDELEALYRADLSPGPFLPGTDFSGCPVSAAPVPTAQDVRRSLNVVPGATWRPTAPQEPT